RVRALALPAVGGPPRRAGQGAARAPRDAEEQAAHRRADDVLLPVPRAGGPLLRRAALPLGLPRPVRARHRRATAAAVDHAPRRGGRVPAVPATSKPAPRRSPRAAVAAYRNARPARSARSGLRPGGRVPA